MFDNVFTKIKDQAGAFLEENHVIAILLIVVVIGLKYFGINDNKLNVLKGEKK